MVTIVRIKLLENFKYALQICMPTCCTASLVSSTFIFISLCFFCCLALVFRKDWFSSVCEQGSLNSCGLESLVGLFL